MGPRGPGQPHNAHRAPRRPTTLARPRLRIYTNIQLSNHRTRVPWPGAVRRATRGKGGRHHDAAPRRRPRFAAPRAERRAGVADRAASHPHSSRSRAMRGTPRSERVVVFADGLEPRRRSRGRASAAQAAPRGPPSSGAGGDADDDLARDCGHRREARSFTLVVARAGVARRARALPPRARLGRERLSRRIPPSASRFQRRSSLWRWARARAREVPRASPRSSSRAMSG
jgi:hypothetical protein